MKQFQLASMVTASRLLGLTEIWEHSKDELVPQENKDAFHDELEKAKEEFERHGFVTSAHTASDIQSWLKNEKLNVTATNIATWAGELFRNLQRESQNVLCFHLDLEEARLLKADDLFGKQVSDRFCRAKIDIMEAGRCLALHRTTACVFHLMRATEVAIKAVWKTLNLTPGKLPDSWGRMIEPLDDELKKPRNTRLQLWVDHEGFFSEAVAEIRAIKKAWRDPTIHVESDYNLEQAGTVYNAVKGFMRDLAVHLDQDGNFH